MEYSQVVRHWFLVPTCKGSNPFTPDYEHPIGSVKNELPTTGKAVQPVTRLLRLKERISWMPMSEVQGEAERD